MKQPHLEHLARRMREHHRHHPWRLSAGGLYIPHAYHDMKPDDLSQWGDVGFILNGRRFMVWWQHPRYVYAFAIKKLAWAQQKAESGHPPEREWLFKDATTLYKRVGKSGTRKKPIGSESQKTPEARQRYYDQLNERIAALRQQGIDLEVRPSWTWRRYLRCMGINLVAPVEVRNEQELAQLADLARQLVLGKTTLVDQFPGAYTRTDWLREHSEVRT